MPPPRTNKEWIFPHLDKRSLHVCRMMAGVCILLNQVSRFRDSFRPFLIDDILSIDQRLLIPIFSLRPDALDKCSSLCKYFLFNISDSHPFQISCDVVLLLAGALLALGLKHRWWTFIAWLFLMSQQTKNPFVLYGGDNVLRLLLFWLIFVNTESPFMHNQKNGAKESLLDKQSWMLMTQMLIIYVFTALLKCGSDWRSDYCALEKALSIESLRTPLGTWLYHNMPCCFLKAGTILTLLTEEILPISVLFLSVQSHTRTIVVLLMIGFHASISLIFSLGYFQLVMISMWTAFLPGKFWDALYYSEVNFLARSSPPSRQNYNIYSNILGSVLIVYCLAWNFLTLPLFTRVKLPDRLRALGYLLRLDQHWGLFAPNVRTKDGWLLALGKDKDGLPVIMDAYGENSVTWDKPLNLADYYKSRFWREFQMKLYFNPHPILTKGYERWLIRKWNSNPNHRPVDNVRLYFNVIDTSTSQPKILDVQAVQLENDS